MIPASSRTCDVPDRLSPQKCRHFLRHLCWAARGVKPQKAASKVKFLPMVMPRTIPMVIVQPTLFPKKGHEEDKRRTARLKMREDCLRGIEKELRAAEQRYALLCRNPGISDSRLLPLQGMISTLRDKVRGMKMAGHRF